MIADDEQIGYDWHWLEVRWGGGDGKYSELIPGLPFRDEHGGIEYWETSVGHVIHPTDKRPTADGWILVDVISVIPYPERG